MKVGGANKKTGFQAQMGPFVTISSPQLLVFDLFYAVACKTATLSRVKSGLQGSELALGFLRFKVLRGQGANGVGVQPPALGKSRGDPSGKTRTEELTNPIATQGRQWTWVRSLMELDAA